MQIILTQLLRIPKRIETNELRRYFKTESLTQKYCYYIFWIKISNLLIASCLRSLD